VKLFFKITEIDTNNYKVGLKSSKLSVRPSTKMFIVEASPTLCNSPVHTPPSDC